MAEYSRLPAKEKEQKEERLWREQKDICDRALEVSWGGREGDLGSYEIV